MLCEQGVHCRGVKQAKGQVYIKISEEEIADDYPAPKEYDLLEHELDEVLVNGDDDLMMDVDPECLPTMVRYTRSDSKNSSLSLTHGGL